MRELELDGIHDDGEHVILTDSDGARYTLRIDEALRAAVRRDRPALGMIQAADSAPLRPREIQTMLRSGRSAEDIAEVAQVPLDHVRRYEGPILAERGWTAEQARAFPVGRGGPSLGDVVAERLAARQAEADTAWDAWRRADGSWTLELSFSTAGRTRQAHWQADLPSRTVTPVDDEARWITDEDAPPEPSRGRARLMAVKSSVYDVEADGSFDEDADRQRPGHGRWAPRPGSGVSDDHPAAIDDSELDALNARRGMRPVPPPPEDESATVWSSLDDEISPTSDDGDRNEDADRDAEREHAGDEETAGTDAAAGPAQEPREDRDEETDPPDDSQVRYQDTVDLTPLPGFDEDDSAQGASQEDQDQSPPEKKPAKNKRAAMPSWDEIVFGTKHD